jgi:glycosidase
MDARFGTKDELKEVIAALHKGKMRFVLDKVVNHAGYGARVTTEHPGWFHPDRPDCRDIITCPLFGLPDFKQEDKAVANFLTQMSRRWVKDFALDGVRMDTAKHVPLAYFQERWIPSVRAERAKLFLLAEVMPGDGEYASVACLKRFLDAGFDSAFNFWLRNELVVSLGKSGSLDGLAAVVEETRTKLGEKRVLLLCNLLDNHDLSRFTNEPGLGVPEREIQRRYQAALILLFTLPGIPQLYYGDELGMYGEQGDSAAKNLNRRSMLEWAWTAEGRKLPRDKRDPHEPRLCLPEPDAIFNWCHDLIALRGANRALHSGYYAELWRPNGKQNAYALFRSAEDNRVLVVVNESDQPFDTKGIALRGNGNLREADRNAFKERAVWERLFGQNSAPKTLAISGGNLQGSLPARSIGVYRLR